MRIDGKSASAINQTSSITKLNKVKESSIASTGKTDDQLSNASKFALNTSGLDQKTRKANDNITQLQGRRSQLDETVSLVDTYKQSIEAVDERHQDLKEAQARLAEILKNPPFSNNNTTEKLSAMLAKNDKVSQEDFSALRNNLNDEIKFVDAEVQHEVNTVKGNEVQPQKLVAQVKQQINTNPQALTQAYGQVDAVTAHGLLGSEMG